MRNSSQTLTSTDPKTRPKSFVWKLGHFLKSYKEGPSRNGDVESSLKIPSASTSVGEMIRTGEMPLEEAEILIRKWQAAKAEALGPSHHIQILSDILSETMLSTVS